jgi:excisionase family DNA binding protein
MSDIMTLGQTAEYLHLHPVTLRNKARKGEIPASKLGRQWRFQKQRVEEWLAGGGDIPEELVEAGMIAYVRAQMADPNLTWVPIKDLDPGRKP